MTFIKGVDFPNALTMEQYYLSHGKLFGACVRVGAIAGATIVAVFQNPADSGVILVPFRIVGSSSLDGERARYRVGPAIPQSTVTLPVTATPAKIINRAGVAHATKGRLFPGAGAIAINGMFEKTIFLGANGPDPTYENGSMELRPGDSLYWVFTPDSALSAKAISLEVVWGERAVAA